MTSSRKESQPAYDDVRILSETVERRGDERISPDLDIPCEISGIRIVHVLGLSVGATGIRVLTDTRLPSGKDIDIVLRLGKMALPISMQGSVVWDDEKDFQIFKRYVSGIHFSSISEIDRRAIQEYLKDYQHRGQ